MPHALVPESPALVPEFVYQDVRAGIAFLEAAFGFVPALVVTAPSGGTVLHAELWAGRGCVMVGPSVTGEQWNHRSPAEVGGANTAAPYLATADIEALHARARAAGCFSLSEIADTGYGSRDFSARDPEGHLFFVGTYRPDSAHGAAGIKPAELAAELFAGARYTDARAAMAWLGAAFGAVEALVVPGDGDTIAHAQLEIAGNIFMLGSARDDAFDFRTPHQLGGASTHSFNVTVTDPDAHCARAAAAGAHIVAPVANTPYGARGYIVRDCEGNIWGFSTYAPIRPAAHAPSASR